MKKYYHLFEISSNDNIFVFVNEYKITTKQNEKTNKRRRD